MDEGSTTPKGPKDRIASWFSGADRSQDWYRSEAWLGAGVLGPFWGPIAALPIAAVSGALGYPAIAKAIMFAAMPVPLLYAVRQYWMLLVPSAVLLFLGALIPDDEQMWLVIVGSGLGGTLYDVVMWRIVARRGITTLAQLFALLLPVTLMGVYAGILGAVDDDPAMQTIAMALGLVGLARVVLAFFAVRAAARRDERGPSSR